MNQRILINFPTNIGDTVMALPAMDKLKVAYPNSKITAIASPKTASFLSQNSYIDETFIFDKHSSLKDKISLIKKLRGKVDIAIDFKNTFIPWLVKAKKSTFIWPKLKSGLHAHQQYLEIVKKFTGSIKSERSIFLIDKEKKDLWDNLNLNRAKTIFISTSSLSAIKQYPLWLLAQVIDRLKDEFIIVILGQKGDEAFYQEILNDKVVSLVGKTDISDVFYLLKKYAACLLCVDSSMLHIGSYLNLPIVSLFGPTSAKRYGPWSDNFTVLRNTRINCLPCEKPNCQFSHECMQISPLEVVRNIKDIIDNAGGINPYHFSHWEDSPKKIAIISDDNYANVTLAAPVIANLRSAFPQAHIAFICQAYTKEALDGNPYLDEIIIYDLAALNGSIKAMFGFAAKLRAYIFDWVIILNPTTLNHAVAFLAKIPLRIGFKSNASFFLNRSLKCGEALDQEDKIKSNLDLLRLMHIPIETTPKLNNEKIN